jgi:hypothetical protein
MKNLLAAFLMVLVLLCAGFAGAEGLKTLCVPDIQEKVCVTLPEGAPDFMKFPGQALGTKKFSNGNAVQIVEHMNKEATVEVSVLVALIEGKVHILAIIANYCPEGFANFDTKKTHLSENYEDSQFMKTGKPSDVLFKVSKSTDYGSFKKYIEGVSI